MRVSSGNRHLRSVLRRLLVKYDLPLLAIRYMTSLPAIDANHIEPSRAQPLIDRRLANSSGEF